MKYLALIPILVKSIQDLNKKIEEQNKKISDLENKARGK